MGDLQRVRERVAVQLNRSADVLAENFDPINNSLTAQIAWCAMLLLYGVVYRGMRNQPDLRGEHSRTPPPVVLRSGGLLVSFVGLDVVPEQEVAQPGDLVAQPLDLLAQRGGVGAR
jgi:hypothetical protein